MCETEREHVGKTKTLSRKREIFSFSCAKEKKHIENSRLFSSQKFYSLRRRRLKWANRGVNGDSARMLTTIRGEDRY